ncbi:MAG: carboxypeptidase-like regulatory domain-containing protein [Gemmatimonas sp.]
MPAKFREPAIGGVRPVERDSRVTVPSHTGRSWSTLIVMLCGLLAGPALAQQIRGTVSDSITGRPIAGAVVMLLDSAGATRSRNITNERGQYFFALPPEITNVRVLRIGFRPSTAPIRERNGLVTVDIIMSALSTILAPMQISASRPGMGARCPRTTDQPATAALLEQARAGLLTVVVAREANPSDQDRLVFERTMDGTSDRIVQQKVRREIFPKSQNSFRAARSANQFVNEGFLQTVEGELVYMAPDADILLDDEFTGAYCFRIARADKNRPTQVGLQFRPSESLLDGSVRTPVLDTTGGSLRASSQGRVDVDGTLWIDTSANAIRDIEFKYLGLPRAVLALEPGGTIRFLSVKNGVTMVDRWTLRLIGVRQDPSDTRDREFARTPIRGRLTVSETGGELARATWSDSTTYVASLGSTTLTVVDEFRAPVAGVAVRLLDTDYAGVTDATGRITMTDLLPGPYKVAFEDERLRRIGLPIETKTTFEAARGTQRDVTVARRTAENFVGEKCGDPTLANAVPLIAGRVIVPADVDVTKTKVSLFAEIAPGAWKRLEETYEPGIDRFYFLCPKGLLLNIPVRVEVEGGGIEPASAVGTITEPLTIVDLQAVRKRRD